MQLFPVDPEQFFDATVRSTTISAEARRIHDAAIVIDPHVEAMHARRCSEGRMKKVLGENVLRVWIERDRIVAERTAAKGNE